MMANEKSSIEFDMSPEDYINSLCGGERSGSSESKATDDKLVLKVERAKYFPNELTTEIVSRLPAKSIARNRSVSTKWAALLHQTEFAKLFLKRSLLRPQLLFCVLRDGAELHVFSTPQDQNSPLVAAVQQMELPFGYGASIPCDPVLGLSCYARMVSIDGLSERRPVIVNPSTGQLLFLPKGFILWDQVETLLGYEPFAKQFKVLIMETKPMYTDLGFYGDTTQSFHILTVEE